MRSHMTVFWMIAALLTASCSSAPQPPKSETADSTVQEVLLTAEQVKSASVVTGALERREMRTELVVSGTVDVPPQNKVSVSFPMGGFLKSTTLMPGMHVNKGEVIAIMEDQGLVQLQQDYLVAQSRQQYLEQEYQRQKELNESHVNSDKAFQQVTSEYNSSRILIRSYAEKLRLVGLVPEKLDASNISRSVSLRSPINGFVATVNVNPGKFVQPTDILFELINPDDVHAALTVFEKDLGKVAIGQKVKMSFVDDPEHAFDGEVILVTRNVDAQRSGITHCHFLSRPAKLLPGMFLNARIQLTRNVVYALPESAIVASKGKEYVFRETVGSRYLPIEVKTGAHDSGFVEWADAPADVGAFKYVLANAYAVMGAMKSK
jgi:cobalt-zinc-cadmium efflux system membrane fusion protein